MKKDAQLSALLQDGTVDLMTAVKAIMKKADDSYQNTRDGRFALEQHLQQWKIENPDITDEEINDKYFDLLILSTINVFAQLGMLEEVADLLQNEDLKEEHSLFLN